MKRLILALTGLCILSFAGLGHADPQPYPAKDPVITFEVPEGWKTSSAEKDSSMELHSADSKISVNLKPVGQTATLEAFKALLPGMLKAMNIPKSQEKEEPHEQTEQGLTGYAATYQTKATPPTMYLFTLFKGGGSSSVLSVVTVVDPENITSEAQQDLITFLGSLRQAEVSPNTPQRPEAK